MFPVNLQAQTVTFKADLIATLALYYVKKSRRRRKRGKIGFGAVNNGEIELLLTPVLLSMPLSPKLCFIRNNPKELFVSSISAAPRKVCANAICKVLRESAKFNHSCYSLNRTVLPNSAKVIQPKGKNEPFKRLNVRTRALLPRRATHSIFSP